MRNDEYEDNKYRKFIGLSRRGLDSFFDVFSTLFEIFICASEFGKEKERNFLEIIELYNPEEFNYFAMGCLYRILNNWKPMKYRGREIPRKEVPQEITQLLSIFDYSPVHPGLRQRIEGFREASEFRKICNHYHYQQDNTNLEDRPLQTEILRYPVCCRNIERRGILTNQIETYLRNGQYSSPLPADKFDKSYRYFTRRGHGVSRISDSHILRDLPGDSPITKKLTAQINSGFFSQTNTLSHEFLVNGSKKMLDTILPNPRISGTAEFHDFFDLNDRYNPWRVIELLMAIAGRNQESIDYLDQRLISVFDYYHDRPIKSIRWLRDFYEHLTIGLCTNRLLC